MSYIFHIYDFTHALAAYLIAWVLFKKKFLANISYFDLSK